MTDPATEWLESLYARNAPEADMARELLDRLLEATDAADDANVLQAAHDDLEAILAACEKAIHATDSQWVPDGLSPDKPAEAIHDLAEACNALCEALGADGVEEALGMARNLREAFS